MERLLASRLRILYVTGNSIRLSADIRDSRPGAARNLTWNGGGRCYYDEILETPHRYEIL